MLQPYYEVGTASLLRALVKWRSTNREMNNCVLTDPDLQHSLMKLFQSADLLPELIAYCRSQPEQAECVLSAAIAALANNCTVQGIEDELNRRALGN